jgi:hypothetical protein
MDIPVVLENVPLWHDMQYCIPELAAYFPWSQTEQEEELFPFWKNPSEQVRHEDFPAFGWYKPMVQLEHMLEFCSEYLPARHTVHIEFPRVENFPGSQIEHWLWPVIVWNNPAEQLEQIEEPVDEIVPASQIEQLLLPAPEADPVEHNEHVVEAVVFAKLPAWQGVHTDDPFVEYFPRPQTMHAEALALSAKSPPIQSQQELWLTWSWYLPGLQGIQALLALPQKPTWHDEQVDDEEEYSPM